MKRIIALLLALILTVGLLPTVALAAEGETPATDSTSVTKEASKDNLNLVKTVTKEGDNYKVTLESWATGTVTTTTETKPLDIVLLLDVSGSMVDKYSDEKIDKFVPYDYNWYGGPIFGGYDTTNSDLYGYQSTQYGVWHKLSDGTYVTVKVEVEERTWKKDIYTYSYASNGKTTIIEKSLGANDPPTTQFYYKESANTTKLDALKTAVSAFIDNVATNSPNSNISIVKFAGDKYRDTEGNDTYKQNGYEYNYTQIVKKLTKVDKNGVTALKKAIGELKAGGATASDYGLNKAQAALNGAKQERVVILFTDGEPNHGKNFDKEVATAAVNKAKELKTAATKTTIYTVGVFENPSKDVNTYMSSVSSNYPNASAQYKKGTWTVSNGGSDFGKYYMNATSPVDLLKAFETISSEVSGGELGAEAVLTDVIAPNFALVAPEGTTGVTAYTVDKTADGWSTQKTTLTNGVTVGTDGQVSVTGFDYSENCVTTTAKPTTNDYGKKLVVEFTIHHNNYGGTQPTNAGASIKDEENKDVITVDNPSVPVTISKPDDIFASAIKKTYDGTGFDIFDEVAKKADDLANGTNNAFVDIEVKITVEGTDYIYTISKGQQSGTWKQTASSKTSPNVKDEDKNGTPEAYEYPVTITFKDAAEGSTASNSTTATAKFTINYAEAKVKANNKSKKATEEDPAFDATVTGMVNGEKAEEKLTYTITRTDASDNTVGDHQTITPIGDTYQNNYKVTYETGTLTITEGDPTATEFSLTGKFQKTLNSNTADVPAAGKEFELSITGTAPTTNNTALTGNVTVAPTGSGTTFSDTKAFTFKSGTTGVTALTFTAPGEYKYEVKEVKPTAPVAGMKYDETIYTLTIEVTESNGALSITSAKVTKPGATDMPEQVADLMGTPNDTFTITNTYTKPTYAVGKFVIESAASDDFPIRGVNADDYQYPTNGKYIVEKTYTSDTITFLYVIKVSGNQGAVVKIQETDGGEFAIKDSTDSRANIVWNEAEQSYTVTLNQAVDASNPIKLYAKKTFTKVEGKFPTTATNALLVNGEDGPKDNTTIEERGTLTVDFGALVHKHLTVTGDKSFNGATFTVNFTEGLYAPLAVNNSIEVYADAGVGKEKLPDLTASVTYTADERNRGLKDFDGADLTINTEGNYSYIVSEQIPAGATGYDTKKYVVGIVVVPDGDGLKVKHVWYHELVEDLATHPEIIPGGPTFYNTIDTGKDDYYPIIIPTIINKDTGMLNKTDHFAYVIGYPDGTVHPNGQITRAEVATIFFRLLRDEVRDGAFATSNTYSDVAYGKWYNNPISTMSALGIITGYPDGTFKPNKPITRAEFAAIAARFDETQSGKSATFSDVIGHWAAKEIGIAYYNDWIKGYPDGTFKPDQNITRAEAMTLINRVLERKPESPADLLTNMNKWTDNMDTSKWYYLDVQEATNSHGYTRKTFNYELWRQMLPDPDWSRYER